MKNLNKTSVIIAVSALLIGLSIGWFIFDGTTNDVSKQDSKIEKSDVIWTCSMHPQIRKDEPGDCPICGMELIPVSSSPSDQSNPMEIKMSPTAMQLASVQTAIVKKEIPVKKLKLSGKVQVNEGAVSSQTSHISGRIEKLLINTTGEYVTKGQIVAYVYSPELITAQEELFEAQKIKDSNPQLFEAVKEKLKNWKLTNNQISAILASGQPSENFPILADISGVVTTKRVNLGDHIKTGTSLYEIADLSKVWLLFDVYESDMAWVKVGNEIEYSVPSLPGAIFNGQVSFIDPVINPKTRVAKARVVVINKAELKPEMFVSGSLSSTFDKEEKTIIVPKSAVMWTGEESVVYVKTSEIGGVNFLMRKVTLGTSLGDYYVIKEGLEEGEEIATNGTFSIDAAAQLAGKPSMMNPEGGAVMTGHNHGGNSPKGNASSNHSNPVVIRKEVKESIHPLFEAYFDLKNALVLDEYEKAIAAGKTYQKRLSKINMSVFKGEAHNVWMQRSSAVKTAIDALVKEKEIKAVRSHFGDLSDQMLLLAKTFHPNTETFYIQHCPMADGDNGADWISMEKEIKNPYFGAAMLKCGEVKDIIKNK